MGDFSINVDSLRESLHRLNSIKANLFYQKAQLSLQILKLRVTHDSTSSVIRQRLGYESRRISKEINNICMISNAGNKIISVVKDADNKAKNNFNINNNELESLLYSILNKFKPGLIPWVMPIITQPIQSIVPGNQWDRSGVDKIIAGNSCIDVFDGFARLRNLFPLGSSVSGLSINPDWIINNRLFGTHNPIGASIGGDISAVLHEGTISGTLGGLLYNLTGTMGAASASGSVSGSLFNENGYLDPRFDASGEVKASLLSGKGEFSVGDSKFSASGSASGDVGYHETKGNINVSIFGKDGKLNPSLDMGISNRDVALKGEAHTKIGNDTLNVKMDAEGSVGDVSEDAHLKMSLRDENGNINPSFDTGANASAKGITGKVTGQIGNDDVNAHVEAKGTIGGAEAGANLKISKNEIKVKADAEAYVAKGSVKGGYDFFGLKVDGEVGGKALAAGAHAGAEGSDKGFEVDLGASLGLGVDLKVKVDWSETPVYKIIQDPTHIDKYLPSGEQIQQYYTDTVKGIQNFGKGVGKTFDQAGKFIGGIYNSITK